MSRVGACVPPTVAGLFAVVALAPAGRAEPLPGAESYPSGFSAGVHPRGVPGRLRRSARSARSPSPRTQALRLVQWADRRQVSLRRSSDRDAVAIAVGDHRVGGVGASWCGGHRPGLAAVRGSVGQAVGIGDDDGISARHTDCCRVGAVEFDGCRHRLPISRAAVVPHIIGAAASIYGPGSTSYQRSWCLG